jgi:hypothetical protein
MFLAGRGVRIKASQREGERGQSVPHPIENGYISFVHVSIHIVER